MTTESQILSREMTHAYLTGSSLAPLHLSRALYKSDHFMQNKPNLLNAQMNVSIYYTKVYKHETASGSGKNKPNSNPNKPNFQKAKMNANSFIIKDYRKKDDFAVQKNKPNSNPISEKAKMNANSLSQKDYKNETTLRLQKNKPNQTQSVVRRPSSVVRFRMKPKLLNFHRKKSLTAWLNSVKYPFLCSERECFYEELYGKKRAGRAQMVAR